VISYRAFTDAGYGAQANIRESVGAGVQLRIAPRRTTPNGTIILTGKVQGSTPPEGALVDLLVHYRRHWEPFRTTRTDRDGRFEVVYQFEGAAGRFPFRAEVPQGQASCPLRQRVQQRDRRRDHRLVGDRRQSAGQLYPTRRAGRFRGTYACDTYKHSRRCCQNPSATRLRFFMARPHTPCYRRRHRSSTRLKRSKRAADKAT
jgi:hypothetical protein